MLKENFIAVLQATSKAAEVSCNDMLSDSKRLEVVDARSVAIKILAEAGYCPCRIARFFHKTEASVRHTLNNFELRLKSNKILEKILQNTRKILANK